MNVESVELVRIGWAAMSPQTARSRIRGALLGTALGDALGAPFEGTDGLGNGPFPAEPGPWRYTDDTAMTLVLAEHLAARSGLDEDELVQAFAAAWQAEPWRGYGGGPPQIFRAALAGSSWRAAADGLFDGSGSFGNGGAMRVAPVALLGLPLPEVLDRACRSARVTHAHPLGQAGAALQATAVLLAVSSEPDTPLDEDWFLSAVDAGHGRAEFTAQLDRVADLLDDDDPERAGQILGNGISAVESVPAAVRAFLYAPDDPAEVIEFAVAMGGDTDTIAAMAGAVAGARCGETGFPAAWRDGLEHADRIVALADRLG